MRAIGKFDYTQNPAHRNSRNTLAASNQPVQKSNATIY
jgi:hypothetical protein